MAPSLLLRRGLDFLRRLAWLVVLVAAALLVAWLRLWSPVRVDVARVERGTVIEEAFGRGTVESRREAAVGFDLVGRLSEVLVEEGARVTLGQELARIETEQAEADLRTAQTGVTAARAALQRLAAEEERVRVLLATAERDAQRLQKLLDAGSVPGQQVDEANDRVRVARADLDRVLAQRSEATRGIDVAAGGAEQRRVTVVRATLLAPFDGLVTRRLREPGDTVTIGTAVLRIVDMSLPYVQAAMSETVLPQLAAEQPCLILFPGDETPVRGRLARISLEADRQTHELLVDVTADRFDRPVALGQRADVRVEVGRREQVLRVPTALIHQDESGPYVYVDRAGRIAVARPRFGLRGRDHWEVLEGLAEGDATLGPPKAGVTLPAGRRWEAQ